MHLSKRIKIQLAIFLLVGLVAGSVMVFGYMQLPTLLFGAGHYTVRMELDQSAGLYKSGNVTYRGTEVGRVTAVNLTDSGVEAVLSLKSGIEIPSDLKAAVHSQSAVGEQFVALIPQDASSPPLRNGDVIPLDRTSVPPDINDLLDDTNTGLAAIPNDDLKTVVDESYTAFGGLGPELSRFVKGSTALAIDSRANLDSLTGLIDGAGPVLDSQTDTSDEIQRWAANLAGVTDQLRNNDAAVASVLNNGGAAADEARALFDELQPTLPIVLANLVSVGQVAIDYQAGIEQLLVLIPQGTAILQAINVPNRATRQDYRGAYLSFKLNFNLPPPCATGYLPPQQRRAPSFEDYPDRPAGDLYCRVPQDSPFNVRGARNIPCATVPGKRAPTVKMCESDELYVPLNDGFAWKGDPNATLSGQDIPQLPPGTPPAAESEPPPIAAVPYDPATGAYVAPDGNVYTRSDLAQNADENRTLESMMLPAA